MAMVMIARPKEVGRDMAEETFGARLKKLRIEAGLTQQALADMTGMHRFGVAKLERDEYGPSWATVQALAKALGISCTAFEGTVEPSEESKAQPGKRGRPRKSPQTGQETTESAEGGSEAPAEEPAPEKPKGKRKKGE